MGTFRRREPQVEAVEFKGGLEDAEQVIAWFYKKGYEAAYQPELLDDGTLVRREGVVYWEQRYSPDNMKRHHALRPKMWVVADPDSGLLILTPGEFEILYQEVPNAGAQPG